MKECEPELIPAITSIIYAATRVDPPELLTIRDQLLDKYGRKFYETHANSVDPRIIVKLSVKHPEIALVQKYLGAIATSFGVEYEMQLPDVRMNRKEKDGGNIDMACVPPPIEPPAYNTLLPSTQSLSNTDDINPSNTRVPSPREDSIPDFDDLTRRFPALKQRKT